MLTSSALECKARHVRREVPREGHAFRATHSFQRVRVEIGCTGKLCRHANEKWQRADGEGGHTVFCSLSSQWNTVYEQTKRVEGHHHT